ncbi:MAG: hypothetical protein ACKODK_05375, partial [Opitutaceae bacterium]
MKPWLRILAAAAAALALAGPLAAQVPPQPKLSPTGVSVTPQSAAPGDSVVITVTVVNSGDAQLSASGSVFGKVTFTHRVTGYQFDTGDQTFVSSAAVAASGGSGSFTYSFRLPISFTEAGSYNAVVRLTGADPAPATLATNPATASSNNVLTVTGKPDLQITALTYQASTSYVGGTVVPMTLKYRNNIATAGANNVPLTPGVTGSPSFVR